MRSGSVRAPFKSPERLAVFYTRLSSYPDAARGDRFFVSRLAALGQRLGELDPALAIDGVGPLADRLGYAVLVPRFLASAMSIVSAIPLVLAGLGVAALVGHSVAQRLPEFGLRLALGGRDARISAEPLQAWWGRPWRRAGGSGPPAASG